MQTFLVVYGSLGVVSATLVAILAHRQRIPMSSDTYNLNTGAVTWLISCLLAWPVVLPAFFVKRQAVVREREGIASSPPPDLPTVSKMRYCLIWATYWWCVALPFYLLSFGLNSATDRSDIVTPLFVALSILLGFPLGALSGALDWWWNREPYYSQLKQKWLNQAGMGSVLGGAAVGALVGLMDILPKETWDGPYMGGITGGFLGIVVGMLYKYSALYIRFILEV